MERYDVFLSRVDTGFTTENTVFVKVEFSGSEEQAFHQARQSKFFEQAIESLNAVQCVAIVLKETGVIKFIGLNVKIGIIYK